MNTSYIASGFVKIIRTLIETTSSFWNYLTTPILTIDLSVIPEWIRKILFSSFLPDEFFQTPIELSLIFMLSVTGIFVFVWLKLITLLNPIG